MTANVSKDDGHRRGRVDEELVALLAAGRTHRTAAEEANVSLSTVTRRMRNPEFRLRVTEVRDELISALRGQLLEAAPGALRTLDELARQGSTESVRLNAARAIVEGALGRKREPVADALRGVVGIPPDLVRRAVREVVDAAWKHVPEKERRLFYRELEARLHSLAGIGK